MAKGAEEGAGALGRSGSGGAAGLVLRRVGSSGLAGAAAAAAAEGAALQLAGTSSAAGAGAGAGAGAALAHSGSSGAAGAAAAVAAAATVAGAQPAGAEAPKSFLVPLPEDGEDGEGGLKSVGARAKRAELNYRVHFAHGLPAGMVSVWGVGREEGGEGTRRNGDGRELGERLRNRRAWNKSVISPTSTCPPFSPCS